MNLFKWQRTSKGRQFFPIGATKKKQYLRLSHRRNHHHPWSYLLRPFARLFSSVSKTRHSSDDATSPDKTALMSFEELSSCDDDSDSSNSLPSFAQLDQFPLWKEATIILNDDIDDKPRVDNHGRDTLYTLSERATTTKSSPSSKVKKAKELQPFARLLAPQTSNGYGRSDDVSTNNGEVDSQHFSISTDFYSSASYWQPQEVPASKTYDSCYTPTSSKSWDMEECEHLSRVTLQKFMESTVNELTATSVMISGLPSNQKNLSEITTNDNISVGSTLLAVSYDEQYPQLVLQPSLDDGSTWSIQESAAGKTSSSSKLGVNFAHPAALAAAKRASSDPCKCPPSAYHHNSLPTTEWLKENIQKEWNQIDLDLAEEGSFYEVTAPSGSTAFADPSSLNWIIEGALEWSQSASNGVKSFTEMIEKEVVQPIISLVDTAPPKTVQPIKRVGTSRLRLVPQNRTQKRKKQACRSTESAT
jgi:hypothetical protein